jgi:hypothetical protein
MSSEDAEDLLHDSVIELFDLSDFSSTLPNEAKEIYVAKLNEVQYDCPYVIENEYWTSSTQELEIILPSLEFGDVWNYLVYRKQFYTANDMNNYKSCKSYEIIFGDGLFF